METKDEPEGPLRHLQKFLNGGIFCDPYANEDEDSVNASKNLFIDGSPTPASPVKPTHVRQLLIDGTVKKSDSVATPIIISSEIIDRQPERTKEWRSIFQSPANSTMADKQESKSVVSPSSVESSKIIDEVEGLPTTQKIEAFISKESGEFKTTPFAPSPAHSCYRYGWSSRTYYIEETAKSKKLTPKIQKTPNSNEPMGEPLAVENVPVSPEVEAIQAVLSSADKPSKTAAKVVSIIEEAESVDYETHEISTAWVAFKAILIWVTSLLLALFLHPGTEYNVAWLIAKSELTKERFDVEIRACQSFLDGSKGTDCLLEHIQVALTKEHAKCMEYFGENPGVETEVKEEDLIKIVAKEISDIKEDAEEEREIMEPKHVVEDDAVGEDNNESNDSGVA